MSEILEPDIIPTDRKSSELEVFKDIGDLVILEVRLPSGDVRDVYIKVADFNKAAPNMEDILKKARGTRGRVPGTRIGNGNGA